jgi:LPS O-antigen subunit length determinant protein (WzzB/FepE family)
MLQSHVDVYKKRVVAASKRSNDELAALDSIGAEAMAELQQSWANEEDLLESELLTLRDQMQHRRDERIRQLNDEQRARAERLRIAGEQWSDRARDSVTHVKQRMEVAVADQRKYGHKQVTSALAIEKRMVTQMTNLQAKAIDEARDYYVASAEPRNVVLKTLQVHPLIQSHCIANIWLSINYV